jgi:hypothetical protein
VLLHRLDAWRETGLDNSHEQTKNSRSHR